MKKILFLLSVFCFITHIQLPAQQLLWSTPYCGKPAIFSPNGEIVACIGDYGISLWNYQTGRVITTLEGHDKEINSISFNADGSKIITSSSDKTVKIWDTKTGNLIATLKKHEDIIVTAVFNKKGDKVLTASKDNSAIVWDAQTGVSLNQVSLYTSRVVSVSFNANGDRVATVGSDGTVVLEDLKLGSIVARLRGETGENMEAKFSPSGEQILTVLGDSVVKIWDAKKGNLITTLIGHRGLIQQANFSPSGEQVVTASTDSTAKIWDAKTGALIATLKGHKFRVFAANFNSKGDKVITNGSDITTKIWDAKTGEQLYSFSSGDWQNYFRTTELNASDDLFLTANDTVKVWDARTGGLIAILLKYKGIKSVSFDVTGTRIVTSTMDGFIQVWDAKTGKEIAMLSGHSSGITSVEFSPQDDKLLIVSADRNARIWDVKTGALLTTLIVEDMSEKIYKANFTPDGNRIIAWYESGYGVGIWDVKTGKRLLHLAKGKGLYPFLFIDVKFSPTDEQFITQCSDSTTKIWDAKTGKILYSLPCNYWIYFSYPISYNPSGTKIVRVGGDSSLTIWDTKVGKLITQVKGEKKYRGILKIDDKQFVTFVASEKDQTPPTQGHIEVWNIETGELIREFYLPNNNTIPYYYYCSINNISDRLATSSSSPVYYNDLWDMQTGNHVARLFDDNTKETSSFMFFPQGNRIRVGNKIFDAHSGKRVAIMNSLHYDGIYNHKGDGFAYRSGNSISVWDISGIKEEVMAVSNNNEQENVNIYPNPSDIVVNVDLPDTMTAEANNNLISIEILSVSGVSLYKSKQSLLEQKSIRIPLNDIANGVYFIQIECGSQVLRGKMVVNK